MEGTPDESVESLRQRLTATENALAWSRESVRTLTARIEKVRQYLTDNYDDLDSEVVVALSERLAIEVTKTFEFEVSVTFTGSFDAAPDYDFSEFEFGLDARLDHSDHDLDVDYAINWAREE